MIVQYYIQNESLKEPYAYSVTPAAQELTIGDIKKTFPLPGNYYFRFKTVLQDEAPPMTVWLDDLDDLAPVPTFKDQVIFKALQIPPFQSSFIGKRSKKVYKEFSDNIEPISQRKPSDFLILDENSHTKHNERSHSAIPTSTFEINPLEKKKFVDPTDGLTTEQLKKRAEDRIKQKVNQKTEDVKKL